MAQRPNGALLLHHLAQQHPDQLRPYLERMRTEEISTVAAEAYDVVEEPKHGQDRLCWLSQKRAETWSCLRRLKARETEDSPLVELTSMALEVDRRELTNRVKTSFTYLGS